MLRKVRLLGLPSLNLSNGFPRYFGTNVRMPESKSKYYNDPYYTGVKKKVQEAIEPVEISLLIRSDIGSRKSRNLRKKGELFVSNLHAIGFQ
jgi:hypothetical protein